MAAYLEPMDVHCDTCGATPGSECRTPSGRPAGFHNDRRSNASVIQRHIDYVGRESL